MSSNADKLVSTRPINLAIIGGGLAGLSLAIGLLPYSSHIKVTIYESAPSFAEIGVGVAFGPNAVRAMGLISPDIVKGFKKHATGNSLAFPELKDVWAGFRYGMDSKNGNGKKYGDIICQLKGTKGKECEILKSYEMNTRTCIHRARFLDELVALIPQGTAKFGKRLIDIEALGSGQLVIKFAHGESVLVDAVVGCDGIKSMARPLIFGPENEHIRPNFTGEYAYRALVPVAIARETLGDEMAMNGQLYTGYGGYIMSYPVEHGEFINIAAVRQKGDMKWDDNNWIIPSTKEDMLKDFEGWGSNIIDLISRFENKDKWAFHDIPHEQNYCRGNICLMGDSAHASTPHLGAGAGMAFEDAYILSNLLGMARGPEHVEGVFRAFDGVRRKRSQNVIKASRRAGQANSFRDPEIGDDFEKLRLDIEARYRWVWDFDLESTLVEAKKSIVFA